MNFDFNAWWKEMKPAECDEFKPYFEELWQLGFKDGYEKGVAAFHEAVKIEREKCAMVAEWSEQTRDWVPASLWANLRNEIAARIRMRSNAELRGGDHQRDLQTRR